MRKSGKPRTFKTEQDFIDKINEYLNYCNDLRRYPNISGFCAFIQIHRGTFYDQKDIYPDTYKKVQDILEDEALNSANANPAIKIFYLKNKFGYADKIESVVTTPEPKLDMTKLSDDELKQFKELAKKAEHDTKGQV